MKEAAIIITRAVIKGLAGFILIPTGILIDQVKPGWETASIPVKVFTGILLIPITIFLSFAIPWWEDFDIV